MTLGAAAGVLLWLLAYARHMGPAVGQIWGSHVPGVETGLVSWGLGGTCIPNPPSSVSSLLAGPGAGALWHLRGHSGSVSLSCQALAASLLPLAGVKIIFRVGLVLLKHTLGSSDKLKSCQGQYETMERLRALSPKIMQETFLVQEVRFWGTVWVATLLDWAALGWAELA